MSYRKREGGYTSPSNHQSRKQAMLDDLTEFLKKHSDYCIDLISLTFVPWESSRENKNKGRVFCIMGDEHARSVKWFDVDKSEGLLLVMKCINGIVKSKREVVETSMDNLKVGIIYKACEDYKKVMNVYYRDSHGKVSYDGLQGSACNLKTAIEKFFHSETFSCISDLDADEVIKALKYRKNLGKIEDD